MLRLMLKEKVRGSISILLVIVMMPMMAVAAIIVDASGYELSKSMVSSAADLTMNTALSYYDKTLKDVYGIFGVSTTSEELQENLKNYFVDSLIANGIVADEDEYNNSEVLKNLSNIFSGNVGQVIDIDATANSSVTLTGLDGTQVSKPEVLKTQIVEFMKYRTPIYGTMSLLDGLGSLGKISEQSKVTSAQVAVNEAIGDFNEACEAAYNAIYKALEYYKENKDVISWDKDFREADYEKIHQVVQYLGTTDIVFQEYTVSRKVETNMYPDQWLTTFWDMYEEVQAEFHSNVEFTSDKVSGQDSFSVNKIYSLQESEKSDASTELVNLINTYSVTEGVWSELEMLESQLMGGTLFVYANNIETINQFITIYNEMLDDIVKVESYYDCLCIQEKNTEAEDKAYEDFMHQIWQYSEDVRLFTTAINYIKELTNVLTNDIYDELSGKVSVVEQYKKYLADAQDKVNSVSEALSTVTDKNKDFNKAILEYEGEDNPDSFSTQMREECEYNSESFSVSSVFDLNLKLIEMGGYVGDFIAELQDIKYCEQSIYLQEIDTLWDASYVYSLNPDGKYVVNEEYIVNEVDIATIPEDEYTFWRYLIKAFKGAEAKDDSANSKNVNSIVEEVKSDSSSGLEKNNEIKLGSMVADEQSTNLPSNQFKKAEKVESVDVNQISVGGGSGKTGKYKGFSSMMTNMSTVIGSLFSKEKITNALEGARDNLFVTDYAFQMFSYYTYEEEKKEEAERKTITGKDINSANNQLYGAEIEYIIFGGDGSSSVDSAMSYIFAIRFACNAGYAVISGDIDKITFPPAMAIQTATGGIVPYKLPELVFELALALAETYVDMDKLKAGESVELFKNKDTWSMSLEGAVNLTKDKVKEKVTATIRGTTDEVVGSFNAVVDSAGTTIASNVEQWVSEYETQLSGAVEEGISNLMSQINTSMLQEIEEVLKMSSEELKDVDASKIINAAWTYVEENYIKNLGENNIVYEIVGNKDIKDKIISYMSEHATKLDSALTELKNATDGAYAKVREIQGLIAGDLAEKVTSLISDCGPTINTCVKEVTNGYSNKLKSEFGNAAEVAADRVIEITNEYIDKGAGTLISKLGISDEIIGTEDAGKDSLLSFSYTDYLRMFLFLKLSTDSDTVMCRIADVIQMNVAKQTGNTSYKLSDRYTYVQLNVNVRYNTLFLSNDWFKNVSGESKSGMDVEYSGVRGY